MLIAEFFKVMLCVIIVSVVAPIASLKNIKLGLKYLS